MEEKTYARFGGNLGDRCLEKRVIFASFGRKMPQTLVSHDSISEWRKPLEGDEAGGFLCLMEEKTYWNFPDKGYMKTYSM